jgi:hypothetical protein
MSNLDLQSAAKELNRLHKMVVDAYTAALELEARLLRRKAQGLKRGEIGNWKKALRKARENRLELERATR